MRVLSLSHFLGPVPLSLPFPCRDPCMLLLWGWIRFIYVLGRTDFSLPNFISYLLPCSEWKSDTPQPYITNNGRALIILSGPFCLAYTKNGKNFLPLPTVHGDDRCSSNLSEGFGVCVEIVTYTYFFWSYTLCLIRLLFPRAVVSRIFLWCCFEAYL